MKKDTVVCSDCLDYLKHIPSGSVDLVFTSPPYAEQRSKAYGGIPERDFPKWLESVGVEVKRVLKDSGAFVLNIKEHVNKGARSTYVLKTVYLLSKILIWSDTFIWNKSNPFPTGNKRRLKDGFEYLYLFTKTPEYKFFPEAVLVKSTSKWLDSEKRRVNKGSHPVKNGSGMDMQRRYVSDMVRPSNVLTLPVDTTNHEHPATFPEGLPEFFIKLLTEEGDMVIDPFMGSGTTQAVAKKLGRHYSGCDLLEEYVRIAQKRLKEQE